MQITIVVPDDIGELIGLIGRQTGRSTSGMCAGWIKDGVYREIENLNKVEVYKSLIRKRQKEEAQQKDEESPEE
ncbi:hypothetical protein [Lyngbya aestuarii]|nr:hypothetical protein [Lyngbya aestuarii]